MNDNLSMAKLLAKRAARIAELEAALRACDDDLAAAREADAQNHAQLDQAYGRIHGLEELVARLRADLATARTVTRRLLDHWQPHEDHWDRYHPHRPLMVDDADEPMSDAERFWLASVVSPPASGQNEGRNT